MDELLDKIGWSKQHFSEVIGFDVRTVQRWSKAENGTGYELSVKYLQFVVRALGV